VEEIRDELGQIASFYAWAMRIADSPDFLGIACRGPADEGVTGPAGSGRVSLLSGRSWRRSALVRQSPVGA
jgi:hypothetical protein